LWAQQAKSGRSGLGLCASFTENRGRREVKGLQAGRLSGRLCDEGGGGPLGCEEAARGVAHAHQRPGSQGVRCSREHLSRACTRLRPPLLDLYSPDPALSCAYTPLRRIGVCAARAGMAWAWGGVMPPPENGMTMCRVVWCPFPLCREMGWQLLWARGSWGRSRREAAGLSSRPHPLPEDGGEGAAARGGPGTGKLRWRSGIAQELGAKVRARARQCCVLCPVLYCTLV